MTKLRYSANGGFNDTHLYVKYPDFADLPSGKRNALKLVSPALACGLVSGAIAHCQSQSSEANACGGHPLNGATAGKDRHYFAAFVPVLAEPMVNQEPSKSPISCRDSEARGGTRDMYPAAGRLADTQHSRGERSKSDFAGGQIVQGNQTLRNARKRCENQGTAEGISEAAKAMHSAETVTNAWPAQNH